MEFRNYDDCENDVEELYKQMYINQSYSRKLQFSNILMFKKNVCIQDAIYYLNRVVDSSDPDTTHEQIYHGYQTAEAIKQNYFTNGIFNQNIEIKNLFNEKEWNDLPNKYKIEYNTTISEYYKITDWDWLLVIGLIHDLGKILVLPEFGYFPEHFSVGDIYPLGCKFHESNIYYEKKYHELNEDFKNPLYNTINGIYNENCGFSNIEMTFSHDYYLYEVLFRSYTNLPLEALYIVRFHSFYAWHTPRNGIRGYTNLASEEDWKNLPLLKLFQKTDLYSKTNVLPDINELEPYYNNLINKYILNTLLF